MLFETLWRFATPMHAGNIEGDNPAADQPSPDETTMLGLLAAGLTDDAIARHIGISARTVQRQRRTVMDRLGANTRFQAWLQASRRNWL